MRIIDDGEIQIPSTIDDESIGRNRYHIKKV
jgi:hypothetical protein